MYRETRIHVVIPAYNVADRIGAVLKAIPDWVDGITVVDDGSHDGTVDAVFDVTDPRLRLLRHEANQGVGAAMVTGFLDALVDGDGIVVKMDGDGQMDPAMLPRLLDPIVEGPVPPRRRRHTELPFHAMIGGLATQVVAEQAPAPAHVLAEPIPH